MLGKTVLFKSLTQLVFGLGLIAGLGAADATSANFGLSDSGAFKPASSNSYRQSGGGVELAHWIEDWRGRALSVPTYQTPQFIKKRYRHAFPAGLFGAVRYRVAGDPRVWQQATRFSYGSPQVIVLGDVILFSSEQASNNPYAWHEALTQAVAFRKHGIRKVALQHQGSGRFGSYDDGRHAPVQPTYNPSYSRQAHKSHNRHDKRKKIIVTPHGGKTVFVTPKKGQKPVYKKQPKHPVEGYHPKPHSGPTVQKKVFITPWGKKIIIQ